MDVKILYSFSTSVTLLFCHCEEPFPLVVERSIVVARRSRSKLNEIPRLCFGTSSAILVGGLRLPRPDKSGLAITYPFVIARLAKPAEAISAEQ